MKIGLTIGKFAPFHKGHEFLINQAYKRLNSGPTLQDQPLYVVLYDDVYYTHIPLQTRADWIRKCPSFKGKDIRVILGYTSPNDTGYTDEIKAKQENYLLNTLGLKDYGITHFFSSEEYGEHISKAFNCQDVRIDMDRCNIPVSGTMLRGDLYKNRKFLRPHVYKDLIRVFTFMGGPGAGKSTLVEELSNRLKEPYCPEFGREYWETHNVDRRLTPDQMIEICKGHLEWEDDAIMEAKDVCFIDTNPIVTMLFSIYYHGVPHPKVVEYAEQCVSRYTQFIVCASDFPFTETEDRSGDANRALIHDMTLDYLDYKRIPYYSVRGSVQDRVGKIIDLLSHIK